MNVLGLLRCLFCLHAHYLVTKVKKKKKKEQQTQTYVLVAFRNSTADLQICTFTILDKV